MKRLLTVLAAVILGLGLAGVAQADLVTWNLSGVTWYGSLGTVSGDFMYDTAANGGSGAVTIWNLTVVPPAYWVTNGWVASQYPVTTSPTGVSTYPYGSGTQVAFVMFEPDGTEVTVDLDYDGPQSDLGGSIQIPLSYVAVDILMPPDGIPYFPGQGTSGTLDPVPLPPSAFLLSTGLIPLVWWRRKKPFGR